MNFVFRHRAIGQSVFGRFRLHFAAMLFLAAGLAGCNVDLYGNLDQRQANEIVATLFRHGIPAERVVDSGNRYTINVDETHFAEAVAILKAEGLPKQEFTSLGEVFKNDGIVSSPVQERAQMIYALSQELARTVSEIDGVISARVHLVLPENDPLRQQLIPSSASVFIRHRESTAFGDLVPQVKTLVANGVAGLSYDKVSAVLIPVADHRPALNTNTQPELKSFMGLWLHPNSVDRAVWFFYGLVLALLALVGVVSYVLLAKRQRVYSLASTSDSKAEAS